MAKLTDETRASLRRRSRLVNLGRDAEFSQGFINVPPFRGSTVLYPDVATLKGRSAALYLWHARHAPRRRSSSSAWSDLTAAAGTVLLPSGLAAIVVALMTALERRRSPADDQLGLQPGARIRQQDTQADGDRDHLLRSHNSSRNRRARSPQHPRRVHRIAGLADVRGSGHSGDRRDGAWRGAKVVMDNTWASPLFCTPQALGVDFPSKPAPNISSATPIF